MSNTDVNFAQFQATGRDVADLGGIPEIAAQGEFSGIAGRVYAGGLFIEKGARGTWVLTIGNCSNTARALHALEHQLYCFAVSEGYVDGEETAEMNDSNDAAANALYMLRQLTVNGKVDHKALLDEMERRNGGKPLPKKSQRTLAQMVAVYERSIAS